MIRRQSLFVFALVIVATVVVAFAPLLVTHWRYGTSGLIRADPMVFQNVYAQGLIQGIVGVVPILVNFWLANLFWEAKTRDERQRRNTRIMRLYFNRVIGVVDEVDRSLDDPSVAEAYNVAEKKAQLLFASVAQLQILRKEGFYQDALLEVEDAADWGRRIGGDFREIASQIDRLTSAEASGISRGTADDTLAKFRTIRQKAQEAKSLLYGW